VREASIWNLTSGSQIPSNAQTIIAFEFARHFADAVGSGIDAFERLFDLSTNLPFC
jgi:hypothetical protein